MYYMSHETVKPLVKKNQKKVSGPAGDAPGFTYLSNHTHALVALDTSPDLRVRDLADAIGITERAVQRILADLEAVGVLVRERVGRRNHYRIVRKSRLRHPLEQHCTVGCLLEGIGRGGR